MCAHLSELWREGDIWYEEISQTEQSYEIRQNVLAEVARRTVSDE